MWGQSCLVDVLDVDRDLRLLSAACYRGDGAEVVRLLAGRDPGLLLQQAGDGIAVALMAGTDGAAPVAQDLIGRLADQAGGRRRLTWMS